MLKVDFKPTVSIIVPCYNYGHLVKETLHNLLNQTYKEWECIIVNDGSTDNSEEVILNSIQDDFRFKYIYQANKGLSEARNEGIKRATGVFIQLLDADDLLETSKLELQIDFLTKHEEVDIVYGDVKYFYSDSPSVYFKTVNGHQKEWMPRVSGKGNLLIAALMKQNIMAVNCALIRSSTFRRAGGFDKTLPMLEDWEFWLRCALKGMSFYYLKQNNTDALVRMHSMSMTREKWKMRYQELELKESLYQYNLDNALTEQLTVEKANIILSLLSIIASDALSGNIERATSRYILIRHRYKTSAVLNLGLKKIKKGLTEIITVPT